MAQDRISSTYIFRYTTWINNREQRQKYRVTTEQYDWFRKKKKNQFNSFPRKIIPSQNLSIFPYENNKATSLLEASLKSDKGVKR